MRRWLIWLLLFDCLVCCCGGGLFANFYSLNGFMLVIVWSVVYLFMVLVSVTFASSDTGYVCGLLIR
jgi:hypothetical protein